MKHPQSTPPSASTPRPDQGKPAQPARAPQAPLPASGDQLDHYLDRLLSSGR